MFQEVPSYTMENACRMRVTTLRCVDELLSETHLEDIAHILSGRTFTVAFSSYSLEMIVFFRNSGLNEILLRRLIVENLNLGKSHGI